MIKSHVFSGRIEDLVALRYSAGALAMGLLNFEDGFGTYFTQLIANGVSSSSLQWGV